MKIYNTLTKRKEDFILRGRKSKNVCVRTNRIQFYPYRKCKAYDRI